MVAREEGHIVNISSIAGVEWYGGGSVYCATKAAINAFTYSARKDLHDTPVKVTSISPGFVNTEFATVRFKGDAAKADGVYRGMKFGGPLLAEDIADNIVYALTRPGRVQICDVLVYPTSQASARDIARGVDGGDARGIKEEEWKRIRAADSPSYVFAGKKTSKYVFDVSTITQLDRHRDAREKPRHEAALGRHEPSHRAARQHARGEPRGGRRGGRRSRGGRARRPRTRARRAREGTPNEPPPWGCVACACRRCPFRSRKKTA